MCVESTKVSLKTNTGGLVGWPCHSKVAGSNMFKRLCMNFSIRNMYVHNCSAFKQSKTLFFVIEKLTKPWGLS